MRVDPQPVPDPPGAAAPVVASDPPPGDAGDGPPDTAGGRWGRNGRGPILLLAGVGLVDAVDKGILPGVLTRVQNDLGFSDFQLGMLEFAFVIATFLVIVPAGYLADRYDRTRIIAVVLASWAAISALTATVRSFGQFFAVRAALGVGETVDDPASQSLIADYYPQRIRGRAYSYQRVTPTLGRALGTVLGGVVAAVWGWRAAFLVVGVPGSLLAVAVWRLREPRRGEADLEDMAISHRAEVDDRAREGEDAEDPEDGISLRQIVQDLPTVFRIPSLRALLIGTAIASGALSGIGFWAVAFNERHSGLGGATSAGLTGLMILTGAIVGTLVGGRVSDRVATTHPGAPMMAAGLGTALGGVALMIGFADVPVYTVRLPMHTLGVGLIVGALPATYSMISQVATSSIRGQAFAATRFFSSLVGAFSPPLIGLVADQYQITVDGQQVGNLALAFALFTPVLFVGGWYIYRGRVHVEADREQARRATVERYGAVATPDPVGVAPATLVLGPSSTEVSEHASTRASVAPSADPLVRAVTWSSRIGIGLLVGAVVAGLAGWSGAARSILSADQLSYLVSGGLLAVALAGLGATCVVMSRVLARVIDRRRRRAALEQAIDELDRFLHRH